MVRSNTFYISLFFTLPSLAWGGDEEPSVNWIFEAPSSYIKEELSSAGLNGNVNPITSIPIISEGMVFFSTREGDVYAIDERDGSLVWTSDLFERSGWEMVLHENLLIVGEGLVTNQSRGSGSNVVALNKVTGEQVWTYSTSDTSGILGITLSGSNAIISSGNRIFALDANSGQEKWELTSMEWPGALSSRMELVYFQEDDLAVRAIDASSGEIVFLHEEDTDSDYTPRGAIAMHEENLIFTSGNRDEAYIYSYSIDGEENWRTPLNGISLSSIAVDDCCAYLGTEHGQNSALHAISLASGEYIWSRDGEEFIRHTPLILDDRIIVSEKSNRVAAMSKKDGSLIWEFEFEGDVYTPVAPSSNGLLFGTFEGTVYSIKEP